MDLVTALRLTLTTCVLELVYSPLNHSRCERTFTSPGPWLLVCVNLHAKCKMYNLTHEPWPLPCMTCSCTITINRLVLVCQSSMTFNEPAKNMSSFHIFRSNPLRLQVKSAPPLHCLPQQRFAVLAQLIAANIKRS